MTDVADSTAHTGPWQRWGWLMAVVWMVFLVYPVLALLQSRAAVGWVALGPRDDFPTLNRSKMLAPVDDTPVWSVNCFVTRVGYRRQGIGDVMLQAAVEYARHLGVDVLEGYPWDAPTTSAVNLYTGTLGMFTGFEEVARRRPHRPIVRLEL